MTKRKSKTPVAAADMGAIKSALINAGLLPFVVENRIHVVPPCTISAAEVQKGLAIFDEVLGQFSDLAKL